MSKTTELTALQRAQMFAMSTRQNWHMLAKQTINNMPGTLQFNLPKARLLSGLFVSIKLTGGSIDDIRRLSLDLNNGFAPFVVSGAELQMYNHIDLNAGNFDAWATKEDETGVDTYNFYMPCTTNPRDPIGLILLQNDQTNVTLNIDFGVGATKAEVKVMTETFSIPADVNAYPDLSVLKLVNGRSDSLPAIGQQRIQLTTGTIYRKIAFKLVDESGAAMKLSDLNGNIQLVFNQADINYSIDPEMLKLWNEKQLGCELPEGVFVFDFSNSGGLPNLGGTRDYIDSANLTEFWLEFNTSKKGKCVIVTETLARLG